MRFHTRLTADEMRSVSLPAGVRWHRLDESGSRSRPRKFDMILEGSSNYGGQFGNIDYRAATWDQWGDVLGQLFDLDPTARVPQVYEGAYDFAWLTDDRYETDPDEPLVMHARHQWDYQGQPNERECKCGAVRRWHSRNIGDQNPEARYWQPTYPRRNAAGETVWACCESSIGPPCGHRAPPIVIPDRTAELHASRAAEREEFLARVAEQVSERDERRIYSDQRYDPDPPEERLGKYESDGAYARDYITNDRPDLLSRIDELIGE